MLVDTHAHLNDAQFTDDRAEVLARAKEAGIDQVIEIADEPKDWDAALALARARPEMVRCTLGLHPYYAEQWRPELAAELKQRARLPEVVAAGEIGLDYFKKCTVPHETQRIAFRNMLTAAADAELPVVIHCRDAYADLLPILQDFYKGKTPIGRFHGVIHCFSGLKEQALEGVRLGFALGVDGPVTYPKNDGLREALFAAGLENLVLETDSPYLPPQTNRGKRNEPRAVVEIADRLADVFSRKREEVAALTSVNARDLYRLN
jgi:TatD DNase family protein